MTTHKWVSVSGLIMTAVDVEAEKDRRSEQRKAAAWRSIAWHLTNLTSRTLAALGVMLSVFAVVGTTFLATLTQHHA